jgi:HlyD family secretion protein
VTWRGDALVVPVSAVFRDRDRWAVYTMHAGRAHLGTVELGHRGRVEVEIASGVADGATVVLHPGDRVKDGVAIVARP